MTCSIFKRLLLNSLFKCEFLCFHCIDHFIYFFFLCSLRKKSPSTHSFHWLFKLGPLSFRFFVLKGNETRMNEMKQDHSLPQRMLLIWSKLPQFYSREPCTKLNRAAAGILIFSTGSLFLTILSLSFTQSSFQSSLGSCKKLGP